MESKKAIFENAVDQLTMRALYDLEQSDAAVKEAEAKLDNLYDSLKFDDKLDADVKARVGEYIEQTIITSSSEFRHVYLQGAKDSIIVMRELGVIK